MKRRNRAVVCAMTAAALLTLSGCSRLAINYQIAESIGTVGKYENNEPVETPKMRQEREMREQQESEQAAFNAQLAQAQALADGYRYQEAIDYLNGLKSDAPEVQSAVSAYQTALDSLKVYSGNIPHLCFPGLIEDSARAFDGDASSDTYASGMITTEEFKGILDSLYEKQYILIDIHSLAQEETDERGVTTLEMQQLRLPEGKSPIIISQDNLDYYGVTNGDGIATKLVLGEDGRVQAAYTDGEGHDLTGDYDLIPILDSFIREHPDFAYQGARGIVSVSGSHGVFGYDIGSGSELGDAQKQNRETVGQIAKALTDSGWSIACAGYTHSYMNEMTASQVEEEIRDWRENVGTLTGDADVLFYPYGAEVSYPGDQLDVLLDNGLIYLCGLWGDTDYLELGDGYLRQTRRFVDGYTLVNAPNYFTDFFDASFVLSSDR